MKKNNKGFFLVEAIVVITLVTSVLAFVYPSLLNIYDTFINQAEYYDQTEDLYALRALYVANNDANAIDKMTCKNSSDCSDAVKYGCLKIDTLTPIIFSEKLGTDISKLYIVDYTAEPKASDVSITGDYKVEFNKYLKQLKKTSYDRDSYRLIGIFVDTTTNKRRYASIKIYNPNSNSFCEEKYN